MQLKNNSTSLFDFTIKIHLISSSIDVGQIAPKTNVGTETLSVDVEPEVRTVSVCVLTSGAVRNHGGAYYAVLPAPGFEPSPASRRSYRLHLGACLVHRPYPCGR